METAFRENLLRNQPKVTPKPITRMISKQLDIKLGPFTEEELDSVLRKIKNRKAAGLHEITLGVWKTRQFDDILLRHCNVVYNKNPIDRCILHLPKKGDLRLAKNYWNFLNHHCATRSFVVPGPNASLISWAVSAAFRPSLTWNKKIVRIWILSMLSKSLKKKWMKRLWTVMNNTIR